PNQGAKLLDYGFTLANKGSRPVGELVDHSPEAQPKGDLSHADTLPAAEQAGAAGPNASAPRSAFGNLRLPLRGLARVAGLSSAALWWRRRRARIAAQTPDPFA